MRRVIDAQNEQEFPLLGNAPVLTRPNVALNSRPFGTSGLARTKENFPALGGNDTAPRTSPASNMPNASAVLFRAPTPAKPPTSAATNAKQKVNLTKSTTDFPALPEGNASAFNRSNRNLEASAFNLSAASASTSGKAGRTKQKFSIATVAKDVPALQRSCNKNNNRELESDLIELAPAYDLSTVSSKHRALVQSYESVSSSGQVNQKIKTVQRVEAKPQALNADTVPMINSKKSFPSLGGSSSATSNASAPQWLNGTTVKAKKESVQSKKSKVAPAPLLPTSKPTKSNGDHNSNNSTTSVTPKKTAKAKSANESGRGVEAAPKSNAKQNPSVKSPQKENGKLESSTNKENNGDKTKTSIQKSKKANAIKGRASDQLVNGYENASAVPSSIHETINSYSSVATFTAPPPGFTAKSKAKTIRAPPGFESVFTDNQSSSFAYISPSNALQRNQVRVRSFATNWNNPNQIESISADADQSFYKIVERLGRRRIPYCFTIVPQKLL